MTAAQMYLKLIHQSIAEVHAWSSSLDGISIKLKGRQKVDECLPEHPALHYQLTSSLSERDGIALRLNGTLRV